MTYSFFAMMARMKYIERWALMRNSATENISEHSMEVAMLAHGLAIIGNEKHGKNYNVERAALMGLYHDATEIITGDMPTPVKYHDDDIKTAYKRVEAAAGKSLVGMLPDYMQRYYEPLFLSESVEGDEVEGKEISDLWRIVKAADKLSALIKCIEEEKAGNKEFSTAHLTIFTALSKMQMPEIDTFIEDFLPAYSKTLDELS